MPVPQALVTRYFQLITNRQFAEAEREMERLKHKMHKTEWNRGYFRALYGMYLAQKSNDNYAFFNKLDVTDKMALHESKKEFLEHTKNGLHGDFDRGYFSAWADCMRIISRMNVPSPTSANETTDAKKIETLRSDKSQATMANFFKNSA